MEKKILITGSNGFLGKNLVLHFQKNFENQYDILCPKRKQLDLLDDLSVYDYLKTNNVDMVIHCAVQSTLGMSEECKLLELENNLKMFFNLERCSRFYGKMYYFGSGAEYSKSAYTPKMKEEYFGSSVPDDKYGLSKYIMSKCTKSNPKVYDLRLFGVFGPYENYNYRFISNAVCKVLRGLDIVIRQNIYFDYMYIGDLCTIMEWFVENTPKEKYYNVCTGTKVDILSVAMAIREKLNSHVNIQVGNDGLGVEYTGDNSRLLDEIGDIKFTTIDKALDELIEYYRGAEFKLEGEY